MDSKDSKKGQVSIFIILGILVLIMTVFVIVIVQDTKTEVETTPRTERSTIEMYVSRCLDSTLEEGIVRLGLGAGYIKTDNFEGFEHNPVESPYLSMYGGSVELPYWFTENQRGVPESYMPPLYKETEDDLSIESQLEGYIEENIDSCLDGFRALEEENMLVEAVSNPKAEVFVTNKDVSADLDYDIKVEKNRTIEHFSDFRGDVPVRLKEIYEFAKSINTREIETAFLEEKLITFIDVYSGIDGSQLPPMYEDDIDSCASREIWSTQVVKQRLNDMLVSNIPYIRIENSASGPYEFDLTGYSTDESNIIKGIHRSLTTGVSEKDYSNIHVDFSYMSSFPLELDFGGRQILEPNSFEIDMFLARYCIFEYLFHYNTKFPVLVTLYDEKSKVDGEDGYMFQFPIMVILKDNFPRVNYESPHDFFVTEDEEEGYECARRQMISGDVKINITNNHGDPVEGAGIDFRCGPQNIYDYDDDGEIINATPFAEECFIGRPNEDGILDANLPPCVGGGVLSAEHKDHTKDLKFVENIFEGQGYNFSIQLYKEAELDVAVSKYPVNAPVPEELSAPDGYRSDIRVDGDGNVTRCDMSRGPTHLDGNERVFINLEKIDYEDGILISKPMASYERDEESVISLVPGKYRADLMLIRDERYPGEMTIEKNSQKMTFPREPWRSDKTVRYPEEDVELETTISGGAYYDFEVTAEELYSSSKIRFYVMDQGKPEYLENIGRPMAHREGCSRLNENIIKPVFKE